MLLVLIGIFIIAWIVCGILYHRFNIETYALIEIVSAICLGVVVIISSVLGLHIVKNNYINEKIIMYETENQDIENKIDVVVQNYLKYENKTYKNFKSNNSILIASTYPDLKSNTIVKEQIKLYTKNKQKIVKLKEKQIDNKVYKWLVYFGG
jgi:hypothetical protein